MAKKYDLDIDGYIGSWFSSKRFIKNALSEIGANEILCRVNSLGGNLDDAIDIAAQFETHRNVTCELFSFNASAATVLTTGAKKVRAHSNSTYLIHKVLTWVDAWGYMNEDDIDVAIEELKKQKNNAATLTLTIAKMYAKKTGKPVADILNLMKEEKWLTANEAKEWGFVDEIFEDATVKPANIEDPQITQLLNAAGLPVPPVGNKPKIEKPEDDSKNIVSELLSGLKNLINPTNKITSEMNKTFVLINTLLNIEGLEFKNGKVELSEDQVRNLSDALKTANDEKSAAEAKVTAAEAKVSEKDTEIQNLKNQITALNNGAGDDTSDVNKKTDDSSKEDKEKVDINAVKDLFNSLPD